ncbi:hypothetical protein [Candidatus Clostridium radicumherbarum]|uniref:Uncharacterized protein n=1 Tax=Candidatus Clostridium radicumherbarum TaxID=3381662 RepID=A0ABW8TQL8_9CLOT
MILTRTNAEKKEIDIVNSTLNNNNIGCNITNNVDFLDLAIKESFTIILNEIKEIEDKVVSLALERSHYVINQLYKNNKQEFLELARISSCSLDKDPTEIQMQNIIKFWVIVKYCNKDIDMVSAAKLSGKFQVNGSNMWFFSPSNSLSKSIEKSIAIISHFLKITQLDSIKNGRCYISKITLTKEFSCDNCIDGSIILGSMSEIIDDFVDGKKNIVNFNDEVLQKDFISIQIEKNLKMQCGNCLSDIEQVPVNVPKFMK